MKRIRTKLMEKTGPRPAWQIAADILDYPTDHAFNIPYERTTAQPSMDTFEQLLIDTGQERSTIRVPQYHPRPFRYADKYEKLHSALLKIRNEEKLTRGERMVLNYGKFLVEQLAVEGDIMQARFDPDKPDLNLSNEIFNLRGQISELFDELGEAKKINYYDARGRW